jgi:site-specific recombinase XerD
MGSDAKKEFLNNVIVKMSACMSNEMLQILEQSIVSEMARVNMEAIQTLPAVWHDDMDRTNQYIIRLFECKKQVKKNTMAAYLASVKNLVTLIQKPLPQMDESDIAYYLMWYEKKPGRDRVQATTLNNERRFLSAFFTWMRKEKMIAENPVESIDPRKVVRKPIDYFRLEDLAKMRDACRTPRERALVEVLRSTGARVGEIVDITVDQIDWSTGDILILSEKSDRYRTIYLDEEARFYLKQYLDTRKETSSYIFPQSRAPYGKMSTSGIRCVFKGIGERAGIKCRVYPHKMRKTLGMTLKNKGVDIGTIQEIMGHASPAVTAEYYAQSTPSTLRYVRERAA